MIWDRKNDVSLYSALKSLKFRGEKLQLILIHEMIRFVSYSQNTLNLLEARGRFIIYL